MRINTNFPKTFLICLTIVFVTSCHQQSKPEPIPPTKTAIPTNPVLKPFPPNAPPQLKQLVEGGIHQAGVTVGYDPSYVSIAYPNGDVPVETGVCSDVVIRAFRQAGVDLQKAVHEDMVGNWAAYPHKWGASSPDANIDHRRVPNLKTYFSRQGKAVPITNSRSDYLPGDVVSWDLGNGVDHIGLLTDVLSNDGKGCLVVHNIGAGARVEDVLFQWKITGHYRFFQ